MCSIVASKKNDTINDLIKINQFRGNFSYSFTSLDANNNIINQEKEFGLFSSSKPIEASFYIAHVQAPTGGLIKDYNRIHPTQINNTYLWHNGIIVPKGIRFIQSKINTDETFDTRLLHLALDTFGFDILNEIEGLFACLYIKENNIFIFRTKHAKLYIDDDMNISSERFNNSKCINYDTIYKVNENNLEVFGSFKTLRYSIIVAGEL